MHKSNIIKKIARNLASSTLLIQMIFIILVGCFIYFDRFVLLSTFYEIPNISSITEVDEYFHENKRVVNLQFEELFDIGFEVETIKTKNGVETSRNTTSFYCAAMYEDGAILVELPYSYYDKPDSAYTNVILKGLLTEPNPSKSYNVEVYDHLANLLSESYSIPKEDAKNAISPVFLNVETLSTGTYAVLYTCTAVFIILLFFILKTVLSLFNYRFSRTYKSLSIYDYPETVEESILEEYASENGIIFECVNACVLKTYVISSSVYLTENLIWVYSKKIRTNGITTGHSIVLNFTDGKTIELRVYNKKRLNEAMDRIVNSIPVFVGFYAEYQELFKEKNRSKFINDLADYKIQFNSEKSQQ